MSWEKINGSPVCTMSFDAPLVQVRDNAGNMAHAYWGYDENAEDMLSFAWMDQADEKLSFEPTQYRVPEPILPKASIAQDHSH